MIEEIKSSYFVWIALVLLAGFRLLCGSLQLLLVYSIKDPAADDTDALGTMDAAVSASSQQMVPSPSVKSRNRKPSAVVLAVMPTGCG